MSRVLTAAFLVCLCCLTGAPAGAVSPASPAGYIPLNSFLFVKSNYVLLWVDAGATVKIVLEGVDWGTKVRGGTARFEVVRSPDAVMAKIKCPAGSKEEISLHSEKGEVYGIYMECPRVEGAVARITAGNTPYLLLAGDIKPGMQVYYPDLRRMDRLTMYFFWPSGWTDASLAFHGQMDGFISIRYPDGAIAQELAKAPAFHRFHFKNVKPDYQGRIWSVTTNNQGIFMPTVDPGFTPYFTPNRTDLELFLRKENRAISH